MMRFGLVPVLFVVLAGCGDNTWGVTGGDAGPKSELPGWDGFSVPDGTDIGPLPDGYVPPEDTGGQDVPPIEDTFIPPDEGPDLTPPQVISAFSTDGTSVTVRFSETLEAAGATSAANYTIKGSDNSILPVTAASQNGLFVTLTLDATASINASLTYEVWVKDVTDVAGNPIDPKAKTAKIKRSVYVAIVWHQHQPHYADAKSEYLMGPWVRKHATKDYYDMASVLRDYPEVHLTMNLTAVLLEQLHKFYLVPMGDTDDQGNPLVDTVNNRVNEEAFLAKYRNRTDPWIDLLLDDTPDPLGIQGPKPTDKQIELLYNAPWSCLSTSDQIMYFFPQYKALRDRAPSSYGYEDLLLLKVLFELSWFDPDFLNGPVKMPDGETVDLSDVVSKDAAGRFSLKGPPTEDLANRLVAENYKIMKNIIPIHKEIRYDPDTRKGQVEISTTPFYHPILPLIWSTDQAKICQPNDTLPEPAYSYKEDTNAQVAKAVKYYKDLFGVAPKGMWPGEGSVAESVVSAFTSNGLLWVATDQDVLKNSIESTGGTAGSCYQCYPYRADDDGSGKPLGIVFRDTGISNKIGFTFQGLWGQVAAGEFMKDIGSMAPPFGGSDRLVTVILDGENAWESYVKEHDGKGFFAALYKSLQDGYTVGEVVPVTVAEYILGNPDRNIPSHPLDSLKELEPLWAGSWIGGDFGVWIGEGEENLAWDYLRQTRAALALNGPPPPNPSADPPPAGETKEYHAWRMWEEMYAAEGSDWFWWYGDDMTSPANDDSPFDMGFRSKLNAVYQSLNTYRQLNGQATVKVPDYAPIVQAKAQAPAGPFLVPPVIDGKENPPDEWADGGLFYDNDSGAIANPDDHISSVKYGYTKDAANPKKGTFYCAVEANVDLNKKQNTDYALSIYLSQKHILNVDTGDVQQNPFNDKTSWGQDLTFVTGGAAWEIKVDFSTKPVTFKLRKADGSGGWQDVTSSVQVGGPVVGSKLIEFAIPFDVLGIEHGDPLEFEAVVAEGGKQIDRAPNLAGKLVFEDVTVLVYITFEVDASGSKIDRESYTDLWHLPPPDGDGIVYIVGKEDKLGGWIPNKVGLVDDGKAPDKTANDNFWTRTFGIMPGTQLAYKYTIGIPKDEAKWANTEEFPLTERGFSVPKDPSCKKMLVRDIFADRPQPSGTVGPKACIYTCGTLWKGAPDCPANAQ